MSSLAAPLHFVTTFMLAVGAFACVWLTISRPALVPRGWARFAFGAGWTLLGVAETLHGAQFLTADSLTGALGLRTVAYFLLLISMLVPLEPLPGPALDHLASSPGGTPPEGGGSRFWAVGAATVSRTAGPAILALTAALFVLRSRIDGARRLAVALGLLGASELFLARAGQTPNGFDATWIAGHGLHLLAALALGFWLYQAFKVSVQARIVASLVLLLIIVIALISATVTNAFARNVRDEAFKSAAAQAKFEAGRLGETAQALQFIASFAAVLPVIQQQFVAGAPPNLLALQAYAEKIQQPPTPTGQQSIDFVAFLGPDQTCTGQAKCGGTVLGVSATGPGGPTLDDTNLEKTLLAGSFEVHNALQGHATASVDDIGSVKSKLVVIGAAPVLGERVGESSPVIGVVAVGKIVNTSLLGTIPLPATAGITVVGSHGELLGSTMPGAAELLRPRRSLIVSRTVQGGGVVQDEASAANARYYVAAVPITRSDGVKVGALLVSEEQTLAATQQQVAKIIFLGALAATLFAVGAASISGSRITRPIRELTDAAEQVRRGDLKTRVPVGDADEVGLLGEAFNQMTTSLETQAAELREATLQEIRLRGELEAILQSMSDGLIAVDLRGRIVTINREAERITGVAGDWARNQKVERVLTVVDSSGQTLDLPVYRMAGGSAAGFIAANPSDGQGIPVAVTSAPITDDHGTVTGAVVVLRDLTSEQEVETMKTEFLSNISHELRTPLTPIKGYADLLRRKVVPRVKAVSFLNVIVASTERMERIVDMLVDFSAMQAGRLVVRTGPFNLDQATAELVEKWEESAPKHSFERTGFPSLPPVAGDPRLLPRAIDELIDNAVKFSPDGGPITIHGAVDTQRSHRVRVSVTDRGIGITAGQMSQIFQDFVQVDASETRAFGGLGLGLGYVRRIIEAHDGELQVESAPGEGSTFSLLIPIQHAADFGSARPAPGETAPTPVAPVRRRGMGPRRPPPEWRGR